MTGVRVKHKIECIACSPPVGLLRILVLCILREGPYDLTTVTPLKTSEKLTYRPFKLFRDYSNSISLKSWQIKLGAEERRPRSNSERYSEIYPFHVRKRA